MRMSTNQEFAHRKDHALPGRTFRGRRAVRSPKGQVDGTGLSIGDLRDILPNPDRFSEYVNLWSSSEKDRANDNKNGDRKFQSADAAGGLAAHDAQPEGRPRRSSPTTEAQPFWFDCGATR